MTMSDGTICTVIQAFPVLLILAQNSNKCLKTPLVYKPPSPTHSPEYYEALDALFHNLYGHGYQAGGHGYQTSHGTGHGYQPTYGYPNSYGNDHHGFSDTGISNCQYSYGSYGYGKKLYGSSGGHGKPCYQYVYTSGNGYHSYGTGLQGYPSYSFKKGYLYSADGNYSAASYAPTQVYNTNNKYKVVVKKTKIGGRKRIGKSQAQIETHEPLTEDIQNLTTKNGHKVEQKLKIKTPPRKSQAIQNTTNNERDSYKVHEETSEEILSNGFVFPSSGVQEKKCKVGCCIPLYQCQQHLKKLQESRPGVQLQLKTSRCGVDGIHPKVCCPQAEGATSSAGLLKVTTPTIGSALRSKPENLPRPLPETPVFRF